MKKMIILVLIVMPALMYAQSERKYIREGVKEYKEGEYSNAEVSFRKAEEENNESFVARFNTTTALYGQENYPESAEQMAGLLAETSEPLDQAKLFHNIGNSLLQQEKYQESIEAYKSSLRINPSDDDTRYNLAYAMEKLQEQQQQQQQQQQQDKNQDNKQDEQNDQQQQQQQDSGDDQQQDQQQDNPQDQEQDQQADQQQQQQKPGELSQEEAERLLNAILQKEKEIKEDVDRKKAKAAVRSKTDKDW